MAGDIVLTVSDGTQGFACQGQVPDKSKCDGVFKGWAAIAEFETG